MQNLLPMSDKHMSCPCFGNVPQGVPHLTKRLAEKCMVGNLGGAFLLDGIQLRLELHALERGEGEFFHVGEYVVDQVSDHRQVVGGGVTLQRHLYLT
jgi:hypothetical protein